jgi:DNA replication protein DnaC
MTTENVMSPLLNDCALALPAPPIPLPAWRWPRARLLAGHWMQAQCETCDGTGVLETPLRWVTACWDCVDLVRTNARACGGIRTWRRFAHADLAGFDWTHLPNATVSALQEYADELDRHLDNGWGLILTGGVGSGKTHCAVGLGVAALGMGYTVYATALGALLLAIRAGYQGEAEQSEQRLLDRVSTTHLLILDDLGVEKPSDWARERLAYIVNQRYAAQLATIVTVGFTGVEDYRRKQRDKRGSTGGENEEEEQWRARS